MHTRKQKLSNKFRTILFKQFDKENGRLLKNIKKTSSRNLPNHSAAAAGPGNTHIDRIYAQRRTRHATNVRNFITTKQCVEANHQLRNHSSARRRILARKNSTRRKDTIKPTKLTFKHRRHLIVSTQVRTQVLGQVVMLVLT